MRGTTVRVAGSLLLVGDHGDDTGTTGRVKRRDRAGCAGADNRRKRCNGQRRPRIADEAATQLTTGVGVI